MKVSESWLREWVDPAVTTAELAEQLTMAGLEVDSIEAAAPAFDKVVVARVVDVRPHPDADKLRVCSVDIGEDEHLQIVCGASNVRNGLHVAAALIGARLPGDFRIKKSKLRGVASFGMLCGASELGLEASSDGLMELPDDAPVGSDIREYLNLDDQIIDVDLTPNRGDCLSIAGIAREVAVLNRLTMKSPQTATPELSCSAQLTVSVEAPEDCPRYLGRVIEAVDTGAQTPDWMQERLVKSGLRPISPIVDVTNYIMLELGHPMHAFDLDKLQGGIVVRRGRDGETLKLLDDKDVEVSSDELIIADENKALALAGIMGGLESAVSDQTRDIFLECAFFQPVSIAGKARKFGMQTDSSYRFERGVDPHQLDEAMQRATQLILGICGGRAGPVVEAESATNLPERNPIDLREKQLRRILGIDISADEVEDILKRLGMQVRAQEGGWQVIAPSFRFDIAIEADLIEEVARIYGYNRLPTRSFSGAMHMQGVSELSLDGDSINQCLIDRGYHEVITYSFVDPAVQAILDPEASAIALANPIASDMAVMRTNLWSGLLQTISYNLNRQQDRVKIFEHGLKFILQDNEIKQNYVFAGALTGLLMPEQWGDKGRSVDFFDMKGDVEALLDMTGMKQAFSFVAATHPALHPGQSARIEKDGKTVGWAGKIHPQVIDKLGIKSDVYVFELSGEAVLAAQLPRYQALSRFPSIRRDLAFVVDENVSSADMLALIRQEIPQIVTDLRVFDVYQGKGVDSGRKSVALGLILQDSSRTLTDQEVEDATDRVVRILQKELGATLRD